MIKPTKDSMLSYFSEQRLTVREVAEICEVSTTAIRKWVSEYEIPKEVIPSKPAIPHKRILNNKKYPDKDTLLELLKEKPAVEIARQYQISEAMIVKLIHIYGCEDEVNEIRNRKYPSKEQLEILLKLKTRKEIAEAFQVVPNTVRYWQRKYNL